MFTLSSIYDRLISKLLSNNLAKQEDNNCVQDVSQPIFSLPGEIILKIFGHLSPRDLCMIAQTCRFWKWLSEDPALWKRQIEYECNKWTSFSRDAFVDYQMKMNAPSDLAQGEHDLCKDTPGRASETDNDESDLDVTSTASLSSNPLMFTLPNPSALLLKRSFLQCYKKHSEEEKGCLARQFRLMDLLEMWNKKTPRFAATGPGIERKSTSRIVRKMVSDVTTEFEPLGLLPGVNGVGSGVTLKMMTPLSSIPTSPSQEKVVQVGDAANNEQVTEAGQNPNESPSSQQKQVRTDNFDFIILYSNLRGVRDRLPNQEARLRSNGLIKNLLPPLPDENGNVPISTEPEMIGTVRELFKTLHGFIYIIDASDAPSEIHLCKQELHAYVNEIVQQDILTGRKNGRPILIMFLVKSEIEKRTLTPYQLAKLHELDKLERNNWFIYNCSISDLYTVCRGFVWLIENSKLL